MIVRRHSDKAIRKESVLPICDKPYNTNKRKVQKREEVEVMRIRAYFITLHYYLLGEGKWRAHFVTLT